LEKKVNKTRQKGGAMKKNEGRKGRQNENEKVGKMGGRWWRKCLRQAP